MGAATMTTQAGAETVFRPRRLGHANLFVSDYVKSAEFYTKIIGFEEVYRQPDANLSSFISNGNTYHDFGLTDIHSRYAKPGQGTGLYHIAFELECEVALVDGYNRALQSGWSFRAARDQDVARSVYTYDPDHTHVEFYADTVADWRSQRHGIVIKKKPEYIPGVTSAPLSEPFYPTGDLRYVKDAALHAKRVTHVALATNDFESMLDYYTRFAGLDIFAGGAHAPYAVLNGTASQGDLTLFRAGDGLEPGFLHVGVEMWDEADVRAAASLKDQGVRVVRAADHPARCATTILDPDGIPLQLYVNRRWEAPLLANLSPSEALALL